MTKGLAIISKKADRTGLGVARLQRYGIDGVEVANGELEAKKRFLEVAELLGEGDKLVVCSLDDICRDGEDLLELLMVWVRRRFALVSLDDAWLEECREVLFNGGGHMVLLHVHRFLKGGAKRREGVGRTERTGMTKSGVSVGTGDGVPGGRPKGSIKMTPEKLDLAVRMYCQGGITVRDICKVVRCNERSMYRYLKLRGVAGMRRMAEDAEKQADADKIKRERSFTSEN